MDDISEQEELKNLLTLIVTAAVPISIVVLIIVAACIFKRNMKKVVTTEEAKPDAPVDEESIAGTSTTKKLNPKSQIPIL